MPSNHLVFCHPLLSSTFPNTGVFSNKSALHIRWLKYWSFSFSISPSSEYLGLISFRMDWVDLLAVQGTLRSLLQYHSSKASILHMRWPKNWNFSFSIIPSKEHPGLISFRMDWLDLLSVQGTLKSLLQQQTSKQQNYGKTIALTRRTFVGKVMSLLLNMLSRLVITFLPRSKHLLIPCHHLQSPSAVILEPKK